MADTLPFYPVRDDFEVGEAKVSDCGKYRYWLTRGDDDRSKMIFIMLNPSTADAAQDDPTIRRCVGFAKREGFDSIVVLNLYALRATDPRELETEEGDLDETIRVVGPDNHFHIDVQLCKARMDNIDLGGMDGRKDGDFPFEVVYAWGAGGGLHGQDEVVDRIVREQGITPKCFGLTRDGHPRHPLYLRKDEPLVDFPDISTRKEI